MLVCLRSQFDALRRDLAGKKKDERQLIIRQGKSSTRAIEKVDILLLLYEVLI